MENLEAVTEAWNNPGRKPEYHRMMQRRLLKEWPVLFYALNRLADNERCNPQPEPVKSAMTITTEARDVAVKAVGRALNPGKKFFSLDIAYTATDAALTALGISVEGENE